MGSITTENVSVAAEAYTCLFGANKNVYRIIPSLIDGQKPVNRRILYASWLLHAMYLDKGQKNTVKMTRIMADTMGKFHPHGDSSIADAAGTMAKQYSNNARYLRGQGNFGSIRGDDVGAPRYIEAGLSSFAYKCFFEDFDKYNVDMKLSYTGKEYEPEYLPAKYPCVLFNPQLSGIGIGCASNIPPFNIKEVLEATIKLLKDPKSKIKLIPDSPTGCDIVDDGQFDKINTTGVGSFTLRSTYEIDYTTNIITITSLPLQMSSKVVIDNLVMLKKKNKLPEIIEIKDYTQECDVRIELYVADDYNPDDVIDGLIKKNTGLKKTFPCGIKVIDDYRDYDYGVKDLLLEWIEYRKEAVNSMLNLQFVKSMEEKHINDIMLFVFNSDNADKTLEICKKSNNKQETISKLVKQYKITTLQAGKIAEMKMHQFNKDQYQKFKEEKISIDERISMYERMLNSEKEISEFIIRELDEGIKLFGEPRKSKIVKKNNLECDIPNTFHLVGISQDGYIKKIEDTNISIGYVGKTSTPVMATRISNKDNLLILDDSGRISRVSVLALPDMNIEDIGVDIKRYFSVNGNIVTMITESDLKNHDDNNIVFVTEKGIGKKTSFKEFSKIKDYKQAILIDGDDKLVSAIPSLDSDEFIIYTNFGDGIRLKSDDIKLYGKNTKGLSLISLKKNEKVAGIDITDNSRKYLAYITSAGRMKLTELKFLPVMKRKDEPLTLLPLEHNEYLIGVATVSKKDTLLVYRKNSEPTEICVKDLRITTRTSKPDKIIKTPKGDAVITFRIKRG